jgi:hypothetical protein
MDKHVLALISIAGNSLEVLGVLYLAYDILGGEHGPLRTLTRAVTFGAIFGIGYGVTLGLVFGVAGGLTHAITLGLEYSRAAKRMGRPSVWHDLMHSAIRGMGFAVGAGYLFGIEFGIAYGVLSTAGQAVAYRLGIRPDSVIAEGSKPRLTRKLILAAINRTIGYGIAGYISGAIAHQRVSGLGFGIRAGLAIGCVTVIAGSMTPFIQWKAEALPARRLGSVGIVMALIGYLVSSTQYWVTLLDLPVH